MRKLLLRRTERDLSNHLVLYSGTSGGNISNSINNGAINYPCVLDLLSGNGTTFKNHNFHCRANYAILAVFKKWATGRPDNPALSEAISS